MRESYTSQIQTNNQLKKNIERWKRSLFPLDAVVSSDIAHLQGTLHHVDLAAVHVVDDHAQILVGNALRHDDDRMFARIVEQKALQVRRVGRKDDLCGQRENNMYETIAKIMSDIVGAKWSLVDF